VQHAEHLEISNVKHSELLEINNAKHLELLDTAIDIVAIEKVLFLAFYALS
jgi:hypothetical protein